ncbi:hypothetical protein V8G54_002173 [Vigna mungo]|uniref:Protein kinase domain-containing protein n=1 Tax=Vigna mungo TaxID=3915 RepID=A0AAQ3SCM7_VIGMU
MKKRRPDGCLEDWTNSLKVGRSPRGHPWGDRTTFNGFVQLLRQPSSLQRIRPSFKAHLVFEITWNFLRDLQTTLKHFGVHPTRNHSVVPQKNVNSTFRPPPLGLAYLATRPFLFSHSASFARPFDLNFLCSAIRPSPLDHPASTVRPFSLYHSTIRPLAKGGEPGCQEKASWCSLGNPRKESFAMVDLSTLHYPILTDNNWSRWSAQMRVVFHVQKVSNVVEGDLSVESFGKEEQKKDWKEKDDRALLIIHQCVDDTNFEKIQNAMSTKEAWNILVGRHSGGAKVKKHMEMEDSDKVSEFFSRVINVANQMKSCGDKITDAMIMEKILRSMPAAFDHIVVTIEETRDMEKLKLKNCKARLKHMKCEEMDERNIQHISSDGKKKTSKWKGKSKDAKKWKKDTDDQEEKGSSVDKKNIPRKQYSKEEKKNMECFVCRKKGLLSYECWFNKNAQNKKGHNREAHVVEEEESESEPLILMVATNTEDTGTTQNIWYVDSGCSHHMTYNRSWLWNLDETKKSKVEGIGSVKIKSRNGLHATLENVLLVPEMKCNLLSVGQLNENGYTVIIGSNAQMEVYDQGASDIHGRNVEFTETTTTTEIRKSQFSVRETIYSDFSPLPFPDGQILKWPELKVFSFEELKSATRNFRTNRLIGEEHPHPANPGSGIEVAIQKINDQGFSEWQSEVNFLGRLSHPNVIRLLGYCWDEDKFLLVYEFMPNGSLECHLFKTGNMEPLSWNTRLKIAKGAARGLAFLHATENKIIFRDFKTSNILLDENYDAKISDFCIAKLGPSEGQSHVTTSIMGTYDYAAPEHIATGDLYVKSDVYGFGVVLLEILTGMRAFDPRRPTGQQNLVEWTKPCLSSKKKLKTIMDGKIEGQYSLKAALQAAQLALKCLEHDPKQRPSMKEVLEGLEAIETLHEKSKEFKTRYSNHISYQHPRHRVVRLFSVFEFFEGVEVASNLCGLGHYAWLVVGCLFRGSCYLFYAMAFVKSVPTTHWGAPLPESGSSVGLLVQRHCNRLHRDISDKVPLPHTCTWIKHSYKLLTIVLVDNVSRIGKDEEDLDPRVGRECVGEPEKLGSMESRVLRRRLKLKRGL